MSASGAFPGLDYELGAALQDGAIAFFVRERLVKKVQDMVATVFQTRSFRAGAASKLYMACSISWSSACLDEQAPPYRTHQGSGGFQLIFTDAVQVRHSFVATVGEHVYQHFQGRAPRCATGNGNDPVRSHCKCSRRGPWFVGNTAALMSLIRGRSSSLGLEKLEQIIHLCLFALGCTLYRNSNGQMKHLA